MAAPRNTHLAIAADLREKINNGTYTRELPSLGRIGQQWVVDRSVAKRAVDVLQDEGLVVVIHGSGVFVANSIDTRPVIEQVLDLLQEDMFPIGAPFPTEAELCEQLGVSRTRLRPALAHLEGRGLIGTRSTRRRIVLAHPDKEAS